MPGSAVPVIVGAESLVTPSPFAPLSEAGASARPTGTGGIAVSSVKAA